MQKQWDVDDLNYSLKKLGWTQIALSRELGLDISTINNVIHNRTTSWRVASFIANQLNIPVIELWPERYLNPQQSDSINVSQHQKGEVMSP